MIQEIEALIETQFVQYEVLLLLINLIKKDFFQIIEYVVVMMEESLEILQINFKNKKEEHLVQKLENIIIK